MTKLTLGLNLYFHYRLICGFRLDVYRGEQDQHLRVNTQTETIYLIFETDTDCPLSPVSKRYTESKT